MKSILFISDFLDGGGAEAVFRDQMGILSGDFQVEQFVGYPTISENRLSPLSYIYSNSFKKKLSSFLAGKHFDFVIIHNYSGALSPSILDALAAYKEKNRCKIIYYAHDYHVVCANRGFHYFKGNRLINFKEPPAVRDIFFKRIDHRGLFHSILKKIQWINAYVIHRKQDVFDLILAPSDFLTDQIRKLYPEKEVHRVYNSCNALDVPEKRPTLPAKTLRLVYFGRLGAEKGLKEFITAIALSPVDCTLTLIGEGEDLPAIREKVSHLRLENRVSIKPKMSHDALFEELVKYDAFVLPSVWYENAPLSIVEAASIGLDLFLAGHGGVLEIGKICNATHFFDPSDVKDTALKLESFYSAYQAGKLEKASRNRLRSLFSKESYALNLLSYLN